MMEMDSSLIQVARSVAGEEDGLHESGVLSEAVLVEIARLSPIVSFKSTLETGSGKSTLLFSRISGDHTAFTLGPTEEYDDRSYTNTVQSKLFDPGNVNFVLGPTQETLKDFSFSSQYDVVLIDGPHAFPFAALEYFYLYPHVEKGGFLILDDIHIPTVNHIYQVLNHDQMFELHKVVDTTAFYCRTQAETFDPTADGWWLQGYNRQHFPVRVMRQSPHYGIEQSRSYAVYRRLFPEHTAAVLAYATRKFLTRIRQRLPGTDRG